MLSTNSRTSLRSTSRKYSAIVSADSATRSRTPGRLVHLPEHERRVLDDAGLGHLQEQVVAFARALADAGEHRHAAVLLRLAADHLLDDHGLADPGAAEHPDLAALHVGLEQVDDLDAGLEHHLLGLELVERGRLAVDRPPVGRVDVVGRGVERLAEHVVHVTEHALAHRNADRRPGVLDGGAADHAVGRLERDRSHHPVADVLGHLAGDHARLALELNVDRERGVDHGHRVRRELGVHDRPDHPDHPVRPKASRQPSLTPPMRRPGPPPRRRSP